MKLRFLAPVFALAMLGACSEEPQMPVEKDSIENLNTKKEPIEAVQETSIPKLEVSSPKIEIPFSDDLDGVCFYFLTMQNNSQSSARLPGFENAKEYFDGRASEHFNIDYNANDWMDKYSSILKQYQQKLADKYGIGSLITQGEIHERACINAAESDQFKLAAPSP